MPAYMIFTRHGPVRDADAMATYSGMNRAEAGNSIAQYGIKPLSVYGALTTFEGEAPDGIVLLEFPTAADARAWYESDAYQAAAIHRKLGADYSAVLVEGL